MADVGLGPGFWTRLLVSVKRMVDEYLENNLSRRSDHDCPESGASNVVEFPRQESDEYDPLQDLAVLDMLRDYYRSGVAVLFGKEVSCYEKHRNAVENLSNKEAGEFGLKAPCYFIRSPATEISRKVDEIRYGMGAWELRVTHIIIGAWLFDRRVDQELLETLMPDTNFNKVLPKLERHGLISLEDDGKVKPSRILLYRSVEQVAWLIDTIAPLVYKFSSPGLAEKMAEWPPFEEEVP